MNKEIFFLFKVYARGRERGCTLCVSVMCVRCSMCALGSSAINQLPNFCLTLPEWPKSLLAHLFVCLFVYLFAFPFVPATFSKAQPSTATNSTTAPSTFDYTFDILVQDDKEIDFCLSAATERQLDSSCLPSAPSTFSPSPLSLHLSTTLNSQVSRLEICGLKLGASAFYRKLSYCASKGWKGCRLWATLYLLLIYSLQYPVNIKVGTKCKKSLLDLPIQLSAFG